MKISNSPGSGKDIAEGKGVHREVESEGTYERIEKKDALFIEDTIPIRKGVQARNWQIIYN